MDEEDNFPSQCHPLIKDKKKNKKEVKVETM